MDLRRSGSDSYDAIIVGGGIGGLVAAAYLARARAHVLLLEASGRFGGRTEMAEFAGGFRAPVSAQALYALDERALRELRLASGGLQFAQTGMDMIALRPGGEHFVLPQRGFRARASLAARGGPDGRAYAGFHKETRTFARKLRPLWDGSVRGVSGRDEDGMLAVLARRLRLCDRDAERLEDFSRLSAAAYLDRWFENDALKAALSFDAFPSGLSPQEAGSALVLIWRYAQESRARPSAASRLRGGPGAFAAALETPAKDAGAELRTAARVGSIIVEKRRAIGVTLASGEIIAGRAVLSCLDERQTLLGLVPPESLGFGTAAHLPAYQKIATAQVMLALNGLPPFAGLERSGLASRLLIAERPEAASESKSAALMDHLPKALAMEVTIPTVADSSLAPPGGHVLCALLPYLPVSVAGGWEAGREILKMRVLRALEAFAPGLRERLVDAHVVTPEDMAERSGGGVAAALATPWSRLLASYDARISTPIAGLYLCGSAAEPVNVISGRAGRLAAWMVFSEQGSPS